MNTQDHGTTLPDARAGEETGCHDSGCHGIPSHRTGGRQAALGRALRLEYVTVGWNLLEGLAAVAAAHSAGSVAILGFGIDSFVECASALIMIRRLRIERDGMLDAHGLEALEHRARRLIAASLLALSAYVAVDALQTLRTGEHPEFSAPGVGLLLVSIALMLWLAKAKRRLAVELGSGALQADAVQTTACFWLSVAALAGVCLNGLLGWWWADPAAALVISGLISYEGREAWRGRDCC
ncbi:MAG: cation transporter [Candidatus Sericytochromatia bacterium]|nr:cation transporter [Candidatus Sericytochromatia bacterium]